MSNITNTMAMNKIKELFEHDKYEAIRNERKRINSELLPKFSGLFSGMKLRYKETGETVEIVEIGELFETIRAKFPSGTLLWCLPEEFSLVEQEATHE